MFRNHFFIRNLFSFVGYVRTRNFPEFLILVFAIERSTPIFFKKKYIELIYDESITCIRNLRTAGESSVTFICNANNALFLNHLLFLLYYTLILFNEFCGWCSE